MALEEQVSALVSAANNLTAVVNGKVAEIDKKVDDSVDALNNAFPVKYEEYSTRVHYVDCINGNDANDGKSWSKAVRTIAAALRLGAGAQVQTINTSVGRHVVSNNEPTQANVVTIKGINQNHYPNGVWSDATSSVIHIDKRSNIRNGFQTRLFGNLFLNSLVFTFEGKEDDTSIFNTAVYGLGNIGFRVPLFSFDSVNRGVMTVGNNYNPFSSLGAELPQFEGEAGFYVKGDAATCILNLDRVVDRTAGMKVKSGGVVVLS